MLSSSYFRQSAIYLEIPTSQYLFTLKFFLPQCSFSFLQLSAVVRSCQPSLIIMGTPPTVMDWRIIVVLFFTVFNQLLQLCHGAWVFQRLCRVTGSLVIGIGPHLVYFNNFSSSNLFSSYMVGQFSESVGTIYLHCMRVAVQLTQLAANFIRTRLCQAAQR